MVACNFLMNVIIIYKVVTNFKTSLVFFALTVFIQVLMLEMQKGCNGVVVTSIYKNFCYPNYSLIRTTLILTYIRVQITEDTLYVYIGRLYYS